MNRNRKQICEDGPTREFLSGLKRYRELRGYTRDELSQKVGIPVPTLRWYETHRGPPRLERLIKLSEELGYDLSGSVNYKYYYERIELKRIRQRIKETGITRQELSELTGYSVRTLTYSPCLKAGDSSINNAARLL